MNVPLAIMTLDQAGADYDYIDIAADHSARERVMEINQGYASVPTLEFPDGSTLTEPGVGEIRSHLRQLGYDAPVPAWQRSLVGLLERLGLRTTPR
jgi:mycoredoxin